jgi:hypothetical protein
MPKDEPPMPAEPAVEPPKHPMHALTSYELNRYQKELAHAVARLGEASVVADLRARLAQVQEEQDDRARLAADGRRGSAGL